MLISAYTINICWEEYLKQEQKQLKGNVKIMINKNGKSMVLNSGENNPNQYKQLINFIIKNFITNSQHTNVINALLQKIKQISNLRMYNISIIKTQEFIKDDHYILLPIKNDTDDLYSTVLNKVRDFIDFIVIVTDGTFISYKPVEGEYEFSLSVFMQNIINAIPIILCELFVFINENLVIEVGFQDREYMEKLSYDTLKYMYEICILILTISFFDHNCFNTSPIFLEKFLNINIT